MKKIRIMKLYAFDKSIWYRVACMCGSEYCDLTLELEDSGHGQIHLNMYKQLRASAHWGFTGKWGWFDFLRVFTNKIRMCFVIMFKGSIEVSESLIINDPKHLDEFVEALKDGQEYLKSVPEMEEKLQLIEETIVEWFDEDDAHFIDALVNTIREKIKNTEFAKGATFSDDCPCEGCARGEICLSKIVEDYEYLSDTEEDSKP